MCQAWTDSLGTLSIALFPFWRFDAKGGEVVLCRVSPGFAWEDTIIYFYHSLRACVPFICWTFGFHLCWTMLFGLVVWFVMWDMDFGILYVETMHYYMVCNLWYSVFYITILVWSLSQSLNYMWLCLLLILLFMLPSLCFEVTRTYVWCICIQMQITYMHTSRGSASISLATWWYMLVFLLQIRMLWYLHVC